MTIPEKAFTTQVVTLARFYGWRVFHPLPAMTARGRWVTATQGHTGWPDLAIAHPTHGFLVAELKTAKGRLTDAQRAWLDTLTAAGVECHIWRPADLTDIATRLAGKGPQ